MSSFRTKQTSISKFLEPTINLKNVKLDSLSLLNRSKNIVTRIEKFIRLQPKYIAPRLLHDFLVKHVQEDMRNKYNDRFKDNAQQMFLEKSSIISCEELLNCKENLEVAFFVISIDTQHEGDIIASSPNSSTLIGASVPLNSYYTRYISHIRELLADFQLSFFNNLISGIRKGLNLSDFQLNDKEMTIFLKKNGGGLVEYKARLEIQLFKKLPCVTLYLTKILRVQEERYLLINNSMKVVGISEDLNSSVRDQNSITDFPTLMSMGKIAAIDMLPLLDIESKATKVQGKTTLNLELNMMRANSINSLHSRSHYEVRYKIEPVQSALSSQELIRIHIGRLNTKDVQFSDLGKQRTPLRTEMLNDDFFAAQLTEQFNMHTEDLLVENQRTLGIQESEMLWDASAAQENHVQTRFEYTEPPSPLERRRVDTVSVKTPIITTTQPDVARTSTIKLKKILVDKEESVDSQDQDDKDDAELSGREACPF